MSAYRHGFGCHNAALAGDRYSPPIPFNEDCIKFIKMKDTKSTKLIYKLTWLALAVSVVSLGLFIGALESKGETGLLIFWFLLFPLLVFVSAPVHGIVLVSSLFQLSQGKGSAYRWVYLYLIATIGGHLFVAATHGAFDGIYSEIIGFKRSMVEPGQVKLERAFRSGVVSNIQDVRDALASGASPNGGIFDNRLPFLTVAASKADTQAMKVLLDAGADPNKRAVIDYGVIHNPLPLDALAFSDSKDVLEGVNLLLAAGADPSESIMKLGACKRGDLPLYDLAMDLGAGGMLDLKHQTCLHHAAATNQVELLAALLLDPSYREENAKESLLTSDDAGRYPLDIAIVKEQFEAALLIAKAGGSANKEWSVERVLRNQSNVPFLSELKTILRPDCPVGQ